MNGVSTSRGLPLVLACNDYDVTRFLVGGQIRPEGIDLEIQTLSSPERHRRFASNLEFDVCELQLGVYLGWKARGLPFTALPVFPYRKFCHGCVLVQAAGGMEGVEDLAGCTVGLQAYCNPVAIWMLGWMQEAHGLRLGDLRFSTNSPEQVPGWMPARPLQIECVGPGRSVERLLADGELDCCILPGVERELLADTRVRRLWSRYRAVELDYFRSSGILPMRHTVVVRDEVLAREPWVAKSLLAAFRAARDRGIAFARDRRRSFLAWNGALMEEELQYLGESPFPYSVDENRVAIATMSRYAAEVGVTDRVLTAAELFAIQG